MYGICKNVPAFLFDKSLPFAQKINFISMQWITILDKGVSEHLQNKLCERGRKQCFMSQKNVQLKKDFIIDSSIVIIVEYLLGFVSF